MAKKAKKTAKKVAKKTAKKVVKKATKKLAVVAAPDNSVPPVSLRLTRDEKNELRKQLQVSLKAEKDPVKRNEMRKEAAKLLKYQRSCSSC